MEKQNPDQPQTDQPATPAQQAGVSDSRRRFTHAGLGVSAIFTLASRPVLAGQCFTPSAAVSGNLSTHGTPPTCSGLSPGYWKEHPEAWVVGGITPGTCSNGNSCNKVENWSGGTLFHPYFSGATFMINVNNVSTSLSMMQVLQLNNGASNPSGYPNDPDNLGAHIVAALLNAISGYTPVLTPTQVVGMWNEWVNTGYFEPTAGVQWNAAQIVTYIQSTFQ